MRTSTRAAPDVTHRTASDEASSELAATKGVPEERPYQVVYASGLTMLCELTC